MGVKVKCELLKKEMLIEGIYKFSVKAPEIANSARAGQFLEIKVSETGEPFLRRPISIYNIDKENGIVEFIFQVKGRGTELLAERKVGELIDIMGPLGFGGFKVQEYNNSQESKKSEEEIIRIPFEKVKELRALAEKYLPNGACGVVSFGVKGGREAAMQLMNSLKLAQIVVHVADARTCVLHPASTTHRQLTDEQLVAGGIVPEMVRFSVGIEDVEDIIADLSQALEQI